MEKEEKKKLWLIKEELSKTEKKKEEIENYIWYLEEAIRTQPKPMFVKNFINIIKDSESIVDQLSNQLQIQTSFLQLSIPQIHSFLKNALHQLHQLHQLHSLIIPNPNTTTNPNTDCNSNFNFNINNNKNNINNINPANTDCCWSNPSAGSLPLTANPFKNINDPNGYNGNYGNKENKENMEIMESMENRGEAESVQLRHRSNQPLRDNEEGGAFNQGALTDRVIYNNYTNKHNSSNSSNHTILPKVQCAFNPKINQSRNSFLDKEHLLGNGDPSLSSSEQINPISDPTASGGPFQLLTNSNHSQIRSSSQNNLIQGTLIIS